MSGGEVVLDTVVLSNFSSTGSLDLLLRVIDKPVTVTAVREELERGIEEGYDHLVPATGRLGEDIAVLSVTVDEEVAHQIDRGEAEALTAAMQRGAVFASDDLPARRLATALEVPRSGSLGILLEAVRSGELDAESADDLLQRWQTENGYRSPVESVTELLTD